MDTRIPDSITPRPADPAWRPPLDELDLAVRLEAEGVTDQVARDHHGFDGTLAMAAHFYPSLALDDPPQPPPAAPESEWRTYLRGVAFAAPMLLCTLSLLTLGFSLWGGDVDGDTASSVAVGTVASLVLTGGFVQAMARRTLFYIGTRDWTTAAATCRVWAVAGLAALAVSAAVALLANALFVWMPFRLAVHTAAFHVSLGLLWIACGVLYMVDRGPWILGATMAGITVVGLLHRVAGAPLVPSQLAGIWAATAVAAAAGIAWFRSKPAPAHPARRHLPAARELYLAGPYFLYGLLYYLFLFMDRLVAWTAQTNSTSLPIQFRGDYETALDLAMVAFVLQVGWVHASLAAWNREAETAQRQLRLGETSQFRRRMGDFYRRRVARFAGLAVVTSAAVLLAVRRFGLLPFPSMTMVLDCALLASGLIVTGLWNVSLLFSLNRPLPVVAAATAGAVVSLLPGYLLSRVAGYEAAVFGCLLGSVAFAGLSSLAVLRSIRTLDHHYYGAAL